ncbi:hypothetical protein BHE74_00044272 [Ensete ventricosum]|uniref:Uncharacterized protein n=1 Tax=Ensete ventricosum TaxID=4639 RepID=A0A426YMJ2_ENSVE|nr:hypothetical protein B296_00046746 [Ensete ventricosum]RWW49542.1 hypothetical protein BHE74_00044272 [Ensete ventricosum]
MENGGPLVDIGSAAETVAAVEEEEVASVAPLHQIESLCMRCGENVISFSPIISFAGELQPRGCCYRLEVPAGRIEVCFR